MKENNKLLENLFIKLNYYFFLILLSILCGIKDYISCSKEEQKKIIDTIHHNLKRLDEIFQGSESDIFD